MDTPAKTLRNNRAIQVIEQVNDGLKVVKTCQKVGIPRSTFYDICKINPEIMADFQEKIRGKQLQQLAMILAKSNKILVRAINAGFDDNAKLRDLITLVEYLEKEQDKLVAELRIDNRDDAIAKEVLSGPVLRPGVSRLTPPRENTYPQ